MGCHYAFTLAFIPSHLVENHPIKSVFSKPHSFLQKSLTSKQWLKERICVNIKQIIKILSNRTCSRVQSHIRAGQGIHICIHTPLGYHGKRISYRKTTASGKNSMLNDMEYSIRGSWRCWKCIGEEKFCILFFHIEHLKSGLYMSVQKTFCLIILYITLFN